MYLVLFCSTCSIQLDIQSDSRVFSIHVTPNMSNLLFLDTVGSIFHLLLKLILKWALLACSLCSISLRNLSILSIFSSCILIVFVKKSSCFLYNCMQIILSFSTFCLWHRVKIFYTFFWSWAWNGLFLCVQYECLSGACLCSVLIMIVNWNYGKNK